MVDPIKELAHDHRDLSELLIAVRDALGRIDKGRSQLADESHEIGDGIEALREALLDHFAREQEGLFPFVLAHLPGVDRNVDAMIVEHDRIADALGVLVREWDAVARTGELAPWRGVLARFEELYAEHTKSELAFLEDVAAALSTHHGAADRLRELLV